MKTKLHILILLIIVSFSAIPLNIQAEGEGAVILNELPSSSYLSKEKRSIANTTTTSALASPVLGLVRPYASSSWEDPFIPGTGGGETSFPGNVGAPIGSVSFPVAFFALFIYFLYRGFATSRRKNNF